MLYNKVNQLYMCQFFCLKRRGWIKYSLRSIGVSGASQQIPILPGIKSRQSRFDARLHRAAHDLALGCAVLCLVAQSCLTLCDPMDCSPPGSSVHGILQTRVLEWVAMPSTRIFPTRGTTRISGSLSCGAREARSACARRGGAHCCCCCC